MSVRLCAWFLTCLALLGCGSRPSPTTPAAGHDSKLPTIEQEVPVPAAERDVETAGSVVPEGTSSDAPASDSVPAIINKAFPTAGSIRRVSQPFPHRVIRNGAGEVLGYEAFSDSAGATARGYGGLVPVQVLFDSLGRPVRIYILGNCETPAYLDLVLSSGLLDSLLTCDPSKLDSVDAVTLATSSSHAIISGVTELAKRVASEIAAKSGTRGR